MGRLNTFMYRRGGGEGLGGTFQKIPVADPSYDDYQSWTDRTIPIVICDPAR
jgi:hypothetical protein